MISEQAQIHPSAKIGQNVEIGPWTIIGEDVEIGDDCWIGPHVVLKGPTVLGKRNKIYQFASIGEETQDKKYNGEPTKLIVGDDNIFRENCIVHRGTIQDNGETVIGNNNLFMTATHVAHDCVIENNVILSAGACLAGHVHVSSNANIGGYVGVHQFCNIGEFSFCAGGSMIRQDVMPFCMVSGHPPQTFGLNSVGLERNGFSQDAITAIKKAYKVIFKSSTTVQDLQNVMAELISNSKDARRMYEFLVESKRGIVR